MGMDVYGIQPKQNKPIPEIVKRLDGEDWLEDFSKLSKEEQSEYFQQRQKWENENVGSYFRNNVWHWRPLWDYVYSLCEDFISEERYNGGHSNDAELFKEHEAKEIAKRLRKSIKEGDAEAHMHLHNAEQNSNGESWAYPFDIENVKAFADFCDESGGFEIC